MLLVRVDFHGSLSLANFYLAIVESILNRVEMACAIHKNFEYILLLYIEGLISKGWGDEPLKVIWNWFIPIYIELIKSLKFLFSQMVLFILGTITDCINSCHLIYNIL